MHYWMLVAFAVAACVVSFLIGREHPSRGIRVEISERVWRKVMEKVTRHFCTGDGWLCVHEKGEFGIVARIIRGDEILVLPDAKDLPAGATVFFSPRIAPKEDRRMPRMCGFEDWMDMTYVASYASEEDSVPDD